MPDNCAMSRRKIFNIIWLLGFAFIIFGECYTFYDKEVGKFIFTYIGTPLVLIAVGVRLVSMRTK